MIFRHPRGVPGAMNCIEVGRVLQRHLDGELDEARAELVRLHLDDCRRCGLQAAEYRRIKRALAGTGRDPAAVERLRQFADDLAGGNDPSAGGS